MYTIRKMDTSDPIFLKVFDAVLNGISKTSLSKRYQLKQLVDLGDANLWDTLSNAERRSVGSLFSNLIYKGTIPDLVHVPSMYYPNRYIRSGY